jgi:hypothetical protein
MRLLVFCLFLISSVSWAGPEQNGWDQSFKAGVWSVFSKPDPMSDKKSCVAIHKDDWRIQGSTDMLVISMRARGGVRTYQLRFNDDPALTPHGASRIERQSSNVVISEDFGRVLQSSRLRVQIFTILDSVIDEDIDLDGFAAAVQYMKDNSC